MVYNLFIIFLKKKLTEDRKNSLLHSTFRNNFQLSQIYTDLQNLFDLSQVSTQQRCTTSLQIAHPKLAKLRECVVEHFQTFERTKTKANDQTRVIIFSEKRDSVKEITEVLEQDRPLIKPMSFIGQTTTHANGRKVELFFFSFFSIIHIDHILEGINQKLQKKVVNDFRAGGYNVLVATSVGEEGLDIGNVDLIICFDALKSPIRLVQRMGRTGRARQGRIILLMTKFVRFVLIGFFFFFFLLKFFVRIYKRGKEEQTYYDGQRQQKRIFKLIVDGARMLDLYCNNLRMVPHDIQPICQEMMIKIDDDRDELNKNKFQTIDSNFSSMINKTKRQG